MNGSYSATNVFNESNGTTVELDMSIIEAKVSPGQISLEDIFDSVDVLYEISIWNISLYFVDALYFCNQGTWCLSLPRK